MRAGVHADPYAFWMSYYKTHDETAGELHETVRLLGAGRRMRNVEAALRGYLTHRARTPRPGCPGGGLAIRMNHGSPADVSMSLNYAADLAQRSHNANDLVSVADTMFLLGQNDRVGALVDEAAAKVPHRNEPLKMSINLAQRLKDPVRMKNALEKLLALGWPGEDEYVRTECRHQADLLARSLREDGRERDANALLGRLKASEARDVYIRLSWDGYADFDVLVDEPLGVTASYDLPRTVFGGSIIKNGFGQHPEEVYVCPRGFDGDYTVHIRTIWSDPTKPVVSLKLETIVHEGTARSGGTYIPSRRRSSTRPSSCTSTAAGGRRCSRTSTRSPAGSNSRPCGRSPNIPRPRGSRGRARREKMRAAAPSQRTRSRPRP